MAVFQGSENEYQIEARHRVAHDMTSPVRGVSIIADLLAEALEAPAPDIELVRELSGQLTKLTIEATNRLTAFANGLDG